MFVSLKDIEVKNKTIGVRIDLNSPLVNKKVIVNERFYRHAETIKELIRKKAKIVLITHQGRKGKKSYLESLEQHSKILSKILHHEVIYLDGLIEKEVVDFIKNMEKEEVVLLKNIRSYDFETNKDKIYKNPFVNIYSSIFDYYVIDAFSVAHREHSSIVGFKDKLINVAGKVFEKEWKEVEKLKETNKKPVIYLLGGEKVEDLIDLIEYACKKNKVDKVLTTGFLSILSLEAKGIKTNDERVESYEDIIKKLSEIKEKIEVPIDVALDYHGRRKEISVNDLKKFVSVKIYDIGSKTIDYYSKLIKEATTIYAKGPAGMFEDEKFAKGTKLILKALIENKKAYKFLGGGHIVTAFKEFFDEKDLQNSYISLSGGAVVKYLANKNLPAIEVLKESYKRFIIKNKEKYEKKGKKKKQKKNKVKK